MENNGIEYSNPTVILMQETGLGVAEIAARTCYDSFDFSENGSVLQFNKDVDDNKLPEQLQYSIDRVNEIEHSELLDTLAWTHFHHSILEHANLSYLIKGTSRGVLQEHARHRIQAISVRSTRYTMSSVINAFVVSRMKNDYGWFEETIKSLDLFVTTCPLYNGFQITDIWNKMSYQYNQMDPLDFVKLSISKSSLDYVYSTEPIGIKYQLLQDGKKKRNVGDAFKHVVNDNWKVDMVVTMNLRALKNYFNLRDSGAAYFQIRELAKQMKEQTPKKYLDLIVKD